jgi:predicted nuclease of predicted toxin-antitoxin system
VPLRVLTDEHIGPNVALELQAIGLDVVSVQHRGLLHAADWELLRWCFQNSRAICTKNAEEFRKHHQRWLARGDEHAGILVIPWAWSNEVLREALAEFLRGSDCPESLRNRIESLPAPRGMP